jgi:hypothetical protein
MKNNITVKQLQEIDLDSLQEIIAGSNEDDYKIIYSINLIKQYKDILEAIHVYKELARLLDIRKMMEIIENYDDHIEIIKLGGIWNIEVADYLKTNDKILCDALWTAVVNIAS